MSRVDPAFWGIHAGRTGDADELFLRGNCIAIGWADLGNLSAVAANRDAFKANEKFDTRHKSLPLRRVYIPETSNSNDG